MELATITGGERQVAEAEAIRAKHLAKLDEAIADPYYAVEADLNRAVRERLTTIGDAAFWMRNRSTPLADWDEILDIEW